jgi:hypothetical protein
MKKYLILVDLMVMIFTLNLQGVFAEDIIIEEASEPTAWDNWVAILSDFASLKNFIVSAGGLATLVTLLKVRGVYKFFKSPDGLIVIEKLGMKLLSQASENPELIMNITKLVVTLPVVKNILEKAERKAGIYELELQGKILDMEAKLSAKVFEDGKLPEAIEYLTKLRDEYEALKLNE